ncbi:hypothetical protein EMIHUDRAFT_228253 [Emiliania huxleyi CCMP1516]|uniref:RNase H type-1 domain-containing protein n=2 Tax=Emiliania huxleyi TaxID=2903 RepID=A0A0D3KG61_EMIH1|nr:hypothetical protein EMIHUDRAFT_228253 [Emiliania huxleyi CCMP1516]EOD34746.1 hypothetical protein EMIHUDRAFT_228253 [Emiliania huxleyi CCMP1516]|eukprot:XP_005787175.1 hypothetical protein EMIHUDRAFT_228253 [Emiliania huxleyi CCMP1516]
MGGDGISDENAMLVTEGYGPVVTSPVHAAFVGARKHTNNTAELSALAELFRSLLHTAPRPAGSRGVVRTDSEYAMASSRHEVTWRHVKGHSGHKWNDYVDKQADLGRSGARDCGAPEWQDGSVPTDADDGESSTVGDDMPINGGATTIPLDDIGDGASSYADDPPDSPENEPPPSAPPSSPKAPIVEQGMIWISYTPSAQARHIGDNKGIRRERAIDIDVDPADSTDVDVITSAATALSLDDTVENRTEDLAEAMGRITLDPDPAPTPRGGGTRPCRAPLAAPGRGTPWKRAPSPVSRTPLAGAADQFRERSSAGGCEPLAARTPACGFEWRAIPLAGWFSGFEPSHIGCRGDVSALSGTKRVVENVGVVSWKRSEAGTSGVLEVDVFSCRHVSTRHNHK